MQARILAQLRDEGPLSKAQLADQLQVSRTTIAAEVARLAEAGHKTIAVMAPAFSADCLETLEEINEEIRASFEHAGGESFTYIPCLNDDAPHIDMMVDVVRENLAGWIG